MHMNFYSYVLVRVCLSARLSLSVSFSLRKIIISVFFLILLSRQVS